MINRLILILSLIVFAIILAILFLTSPAVIGPVGILFFFVWCGYFFYAFFCYDLFFKKEYD